MTEVRRQKTDEFTASKSDLSVLCFLTSVFWILENLIADETLHLNLYVRWENDESLI